MFVPSKFLTHFFAPACGGGALLLSAAVGAQDLADQQGLAVGEAELFPSIRIDYISDNNVGLLPEDELDGTAVVVQPSAVFVADSSQLVFRAGYDGAYSVGSESALDWDDHRLSAELAAEFDARRRARVSLVFGRLHQELGRNFTRGLGASVDEPVQFNDFRLNTTFGYGVPNARGNLQAGVRIETRNFTNLNALTDGRSFSSVEPFGRFGYRLGGDTRGFVEVRAGTFRFDNDNLDRDELGVVFGLAFNATGRLDGEISIGLENVSFAATGAEDDTLFVLESNLRYSPRTFSVLTLDISRGINNSGFNVVADSAGESIATVARVGWEHEWTSQVSTDAFARTSIQEEICPAIGDTTNTVGFELNVAVRRWLAFGASVETESRRADSCAADDGADALDYDRQLLGVHVRATL